MLLAFTLAVEEYGVPAALGTRAGVVMLTVELKRAGRLAIDMPGAALLSVVLIAIALGGWWLQRKFTGDSDVTSVVKPTEHVGARLGLAAVPVVIIMALVGLIAVVLPSCRWQSPSSVRHSAGLSLDNLTVKHFAALFAERGDALGARHQSVAGAGGGAVHRFTGAVHCTGWWYYRR